MTFKLYCSPELLFGIFLDSTNNNETQQKQLMTMSKEQSCKSKVICAIHQMRLLAFIVSFSVVGKNSVIIQKDDCDSHKNNLYLLS
jgi:hypothetical protein